MRIRASWVAIFVYGVAGHTQPAVAQVDQQRAQEYFKEAQALCEGDGGRLWGVSVCGPMVIADRRTQTFATSQPAPAAPRPPLIGIVNAPIEWGGTMWAAYMWETLANVTPRARNEILLHELFHIVQLRLGLRATGPGLSNEHLDTLEGRYWLRLEFRALARALRESGEARKVAVGDVLVFRQARRALDPAAADNERAVEIIEGVASYAGTILAASSTAESKASALEQLSDPDGEESYVRTFAYKSGSAYGLLLDASSPDWKRTLRGDDDLGVLLMNALAVRPADDAAAAAAGYGGAELRAAEQQRDQERQARIAELRRRFVDGPVLVMPGGGSGMSNSMGAVVIPGGTVFFGPYRAAGPWGTLEAENGVLQASDGLSRRLPAPTRRDDGTVSGDGWTFKGAPGWVVREGARPGDYEVVRQQQP